MKCTIDNGVLTVTAESEQETEELREWRAKWHTKPKAELWFKCCYYNPTQVLVV